MVENSKRRKNIVLGRIAVFVGTLLVLFLVCKFALFFMPFLVAGIIAVLIEPIIKFCMNKLKMSRGMSSGIVVFLTVLLLIGLSIWGVSELVSELLTMTSNIGPTFAQASATIVEWASKISNEYSEIPAQVISTVQNSLVDFVGKLGNYIGSLATKAFNMVLSVPTLLINITITIFNVPRETLSYETKKEYILNYLIKMYIFLYNNNILFNYKTYYINNYY